MACESDENTVGGTRDALDERRVVKNHCRLLQSRGERGEKMLDGRIGGTTVSVVQLVAVSRFEIVETVDRMIPVYSGKQRGWCYVS